MLLNTPIQSLWIGPQLSKMEEVCIRSYLSHGHEFHLYVYDTIKNVPDGTILKDANHIIPENEIFRDEFGGFVNFSNRFRYIMLLKIGGWWVDMDTVCLKPFDFDDDFVFSSETFDPYKRILVNTTFIKSLPGAKFLSDCLDFLNNRGNENIHWGELGVNLISRMIFRSGLGKFVKQPEVFCPISGYHIELLINDSNYIIPDISYALHWWNELWRRKGLNKDSEFDSNSIYEVLNRKYGKH